MVKDFDLDKNFYYWGQCRLGSLLPFIANKLYLLALFSPIICITLVHHIFQLICIVIIDVLFKNKLSSLLIVFCILIPLPEHHTFLMLGHPYLAQITCILLGVFYFIKAYKSELTINRYNKLLKSVLGIFFCLLSVWVSELSIVIVILILSSALVYILFNSNNKRVDIVIFSVSVIAFIICLFLLNIKKTATCAPGELEITTGLIDINEFPSSLALVYKTFFGGEGNIILLLFRFIYVLLIVYISVYSFIFFARKYKEPSSLLLFFMTGIFWGTLMATTLSNWVKLNYYDSRYFSLQFVEGIFIVAMFIAIKPINKVNYFSVSIPCLVGYTVLVYFKTSGPILNKDYSYKELEKFGSMGNIGVIGNYWNSYIIAMRNPEMISATPHDKDNIRDVDQINKVFYSSKIILIKNDWLDSFPDTLTQFNNKLVKSGTPQTISRIEYCEYQLR